MWQSNHHLHCSSVIYTATFSWWQNGLDSTSKTDGVRRTLTGVKVQTMIQSSSAEYCSFGLYLECRVVSLYLVNTKCNSRSLFVYSSEQTLTELRYFSKVTTKLGYRVEKYYSMRSYLKTLRKTAELLVCQVSQRTKKV